MKKYYEFKQNNSGGGFDKDEKLCRRLFIEADDSEQAVEKALELGVYFDGVDKGIDCECCGDRWSNFPHEIVLPYMYAKDLVFDDIEKYAQYIADEYGWGDLDGRVFYKSGKVVEIYCKK